VIERGVGRADAAMRILNADGSEVESCGNATRCVAKFLIEELDKPVVRIDTLGGELECYEADGGEITVDMGPPRFGWRDVPLASDVDTNCFPLSLDGSTRPVAALSIGNPHCVLFVDDADAADVAGIGARIEHHPMFPKRTNVEFVTVKNASHLRMRVWERGVGITLACGSGACAAFAAANRRGFVGKEAAVELDGGTLKIALRGDDSHLLMTGPTALSFRGDLDVENLA
jgi:diaminopimelate epimerase